MASIAVSLERTRGPYEFGPAARAAAAIADAVLERGLPGRTFLNLNVPAGEPRGMRVTVQAKRNHFTVVDARTDPRGGSYYWIDEGQNNWEADDRSDYQAVRDGYVSITPLQPDLTAYDAMAHVEGLKDISEAARREGRIAVHACRGVAQPGRALGSGPRGRWFESTRPDQLSPPVVQRMCNGRSMGRLHRRPFSSAAGQPVRSAQGPRVAGSNPAPATNRIKGLQPLA